MLIAVAGSTGLGQVAGISSTHPAALLKALQTQPSDHVIVLAPQHAASVAREQAHVVLAARPEARVCVLALSHHALTLTLIGAVALELEQTPNGWSEPGGAVQVIREAAARSRSLVWFPRAWGLHKPEPSLGQRAASLFKAQGFFAEVGTDGLAAGRTGISWAPDELVCAAGEPPALLRSQLGGSSCTAVEVSPEAGAPYASKASVELTGLVRPTRRPVLGEPCDSCSARRTAAECFFCGCGPRAGLTSLKQRQVVDRADMNSVRGTAA